jgi:hypothetical protein
MLTVKWLHNGAGYGYGHFAGDVSEISDEDAAKLIELSAVLIIPDTIDAPPAVSNTTFNPNNKLHLR